MTRKLSIWESEISKISFIKMKKGFITGLLIDVSQRIIIVLYAQDFIILRIQVNPL